MANSRPLRAYPHPDDETLLALTLLGLGTYASFRDLGYGANDGGGGGALLFLVCAPILCGSAALVFLYLTLVLPPCVLAKRDDAAAFGDGGCRIEGTVAECLAEKDHGKPAYRMAVRYSVVVPGGGETELEKEFREVAKAYPTGSTVALRVVRDEPRSVLLYNDDGRSWGEDPRTTRAKRWSSAAAALVAAALYVSYVAWFSASIIAESDPKLLHLAKVVTKQTLCVGGAVYYGILRRLTRTLSEKRCRTRWGATVVHRRRVDGDDDEPCKSR